MIDPEDFRLAEDWRLGRPGAVEAVLGRFEKPIFNLVLRMVNNYEDAEDIVQQVFLKASQKLDRFDPRYKLFSWLYRIAVNESLNFLKSRRTFGDLGESRPAPNPTPETEFGSGEFVQNLHSALMDLKEDYRTVVILKHLHGCSYTEMAEILSIPEKTVKSRLFTARQLLRDRLQQRGLL